MVKRLKSWDEYVEEAKREPVEVPLPDGEVLTVEQPTGAVAKLLDIALAEGSQEKIVLALFGTKNGRRLIKMTDEAPSSVLTSIVNDVLDEFRVDTAGDSDASSS